MNSRDGLARRLGIPLSQLAEVRLEYAPRLVAKHGGGGTREIMVPQPPLREILDLIQTKVLGTMRPHPAAHGYVKNRSVVTNAKRHVARKLVVTLDIENFFGSIGPTSVARLFERLGWSGEAVEALTALVMTPEQQGIPQGAPTSPTLSNLIMREVDEGLSKFAVENGWTFTRYADDLAFSSDEDRMDVGALIEIARANLAPLRLQLNERKILIQPAGQRQVIAGVIVNDKPAVPPDEYRALRAMLHNAKKSSALPPHF